MNLEKLAVVCKTIQANNVFSDASLVAAGGTDWTTNKCFLAGTRKLT